MTSTPLRKACSCGPMPTPPKTAAPVSGVWTASSSRCVVDLRAPARASGVSTSARVGAARLAEEPVQDRQQERGGLAAAGHGAGEHVAAGERGRDGVVLDRGGAGEAELARGAHDGGVEAEGGERHASGGYSTSVSHLGATAPGVSSLAWIWSGAPGWPAVPGSDHQIAALHVRLSSHHLSDRTQCVDDRRAGRVRGEGRERLERASAVRRARQREDIGMLRLEPGDCRLQHLEQPLVEQRDARGRRLVVRRAGRPPPARA